MRQGTGQYQGRLSRALSCLGSESPSAFKESFEKGTAHSDTRNHHLLSGQQSLNRFSSRRSQQATVSPLGPLMHPPPPPEAAPLPSVERDLSSSARILLSCSIFAMMRSISDEAFSGPPPPEPGSGELPVKPLEPVMKLEPPVVLVYTPDEMELRELRPGGTGGDC